MFDETKFFGYLNPRMIIALMDISEFGLQPTPPTLGESIKPIGPRFYMTYLDQVWFLLFAPGTRECIVGYSDEILRNTSDNDDDDDEDAYKKRAAVEAADETAMAQAFDVTLEQEASRGMGGLVQLRATKKLGGWTVMTFQFSLDCGLMADAIMMLPSSHPAHSALMRSLFLLKNDVMPVLEIRKPNL